MTSDVLLNHAWKQGDTVLRSGKDQRPLGTEKQQREYLSSRSLMYVYPSYTPFLSVTTNFKYSRITMMKSAAVLALLSASASAFAPTVTQQQSLVSLNAERSKALPFMNRPPLVSSRWQLHCTIAKKHSSQQKVHMWMNADWWTMK